MEYTFETFILNLREKVGDCMVEATEASKHKYYERVFSCLDKAEAYIKIAKIKTERRIKKEEQ